MVIVPVWFLGSWLDWKPLLVMIVLVQVNFGSVATRLLMWAKFWW